MFACLHAPAPEPPGVLHALARECSPRVESHGDGLLAIDIGGLERLIGDGPAIGRAIERAAAGRGVRVQVAVAAAWTAGLILAQARTGLTVVPPGDEATWLAPLPIEVLRSFEFRVASSGLRLGTRNSELATRNSQLLATFRRWGLKTLGELAALPTADLSARLGIAGIAWQRLARGEDPRPLVPDEPDERFEASLELDWPIEGLEPLSFVLGRLLDTMSAQLERRGRAAAVLHLRLALVTREVFARRLQLAAPVRDPRVLRTLILLDLESHRLPAAIDRVSLAIDPVPARITQFALFNHAAPLPESLATVLARLGALVGEARCGAPVLLDTHRPGAFTMAPFSTDSSRQSTVDRRQSAVTTSEARSPRPGARRSGSDALFVALRRFRLPVPARVALERGCPVRVVTDRRGLEGGAVRACAGPWRSSGHWWHGPPLRAKDQRPGETTDAWDRDEWDVALSDDGVYRIFCERGRWFVEGIMD